MLVLSPVISDPDQQVHEWVIEPQRWRIRIYYDDRRQAWFVDASPLDGSGGGVAGEIAEPYQVLGRTSGEPLLDGLCVLVPRSGEVSDLDWESMGYTHLLVVFDDQGSESVADDGWEKL